MNIYREKTDLYLKDTAVENLFISEYMVTADGDYVKLYLLAKMYAGSGEECSNAGLARELGLPLQKVMDAWNYWESRGLLRRIYSGREPGEFDLEFISPKQQMYGLEPTTAEDSLPEEEDIARLNAASWSQNALVLFRSVESTLGRTLSSREMNDLQMWLEDWGMSPEVILQAYEVCIKERRKSAIYPPSSAPGTNTGCSGKIPWKNTWRNTTGATASTGGSSKPWASSAGCRRRKSVGS